MDCSMDVDSGEENVWAPLCQAALRGLSVPPNVPPTTESLALYLCPATPFSQYAALSNLRIGAAREVLQHILSLKPTPETTAAAVRVAVVLGDTPELPRACEALSGRGDACWSLRTRSLLAYFAGPAARGVLSWASTFARFASTGGVVADDGTEYDVPGEEAEMRMAVAFVLGIGNTGASRVLPPVVSWDEQLDRGVVQSPTVWREVSWARFATRCMLGQADARVPQLPCHGSIEEFEFATDNQSELGVVGRKEYVTIEGVRLRRRRPRASAIDATSHVALNPSNPASLPTGSGRSNVVEDREKKDEENLGCTDVENVGGAASPSTYSSRRVCVQTPSVRETAVRIARGLADGRPVLVEGPPGCGKSELLSHIARFAAPHGAAEGDDDSVVRVQMDSIIGISGDDEFSILIGAVVPLPDGGGFRWRPGPIGAALQRGAWLILENMGGSRGSLSSSVSATIAQLAQLRTGDSFEAPGRGYPIHVAPGFAILATRTTAQTGPEENIATAEMVSSDWEPPGTWVLWRQIRMPGLHTDDLTAILKGRFPCIEDCVPRILSSLSEVRTELCSVAGRPSSTSRVPNMRDAVTLSQRLVALRSSSRDLLTPETAVLESMDVLCNWERNMKARVALLARVAQAWSLGSDVAVSLMSSVIPTFSASCGFFQVGRARLQSNEYQLPLKNARLAARTTRAPVGNLSMNGHTLRLLERVARCVEMGESVLLSGESGTGKTASIQELATRLGKRLVVVNLSRNSDIGDLLGGFRPIDLASSISALARLFESAFCSIVSREKNSRFLHALRAASRSRAQHKRTLKLIRGAVNALPNALFSEHRLEDGASWPNVIAELSRLESLLEPSSSLPASAARLSSRNPVLTAEGAPVTSAPGAGKRRTPEASEGDSDDVAKGPSGQGISFEFGEGVLVSAMRSGDWILLDEINLAPVEVLERLVGLVDDRCLSLSKSKAEVVSCAPGFALFAAMNPPTDVGKRPLPTALRSRFTEFFVDDVRTRADIVALSLKRLFNLDVEHKRGHGQEQYELCENIADFYISCRDLADQGHLSDGNDKKVRYSLRSLSRMLDFASSIFRNMGSMSSGYRRALYEGAHLAFITPLPRNSRKKVDEVACKLILRGAGPEVLKRQVPKKRNHGLSMLSEVMKPPCGVSVTKVAGYYLECSPSIGDCKNAISGVDPTHFVVTETVGRTLQDVCRALVVGAPRLPVLLQGPTAAGKTSVVAYLAKLTGKQLVRINNHEHTDVGEYLGGYVASEDGSLHFQEGPMVRAARRGDWVVLDELNLAPAEVLEALNRLLDDNREVRVPETGEVVKAAEGFAIFATQNPPGLYGGRKELSRAFRSRFVEVQVGDLSDVDLREILGCKNQIPVSFSERMVSTMRELQMRRSASHIFSGKSGFVTARDLFRWAARRPQSREELAAAGFFLLGERSRLDSERQIVRDVLAKHMGISPCVLEDENLYRMDSSTSQDGGLWDSETILFFSKLRVCAEEAGIALTPAMRRILTLVGHCVLNDEPVLLVGATGCGKTTACSVVAQALKISLATVSCHRHSEASDFIGSYRPVIRQAASSEKNRKLFHWADGPLVNAMKNGQAFLVDEINMAEDAVTERLNSVLEVERTLLLTEKGSVSGADMNGNGSGPEVVKGANGFAVFAAMNPGGDFGKKELSPALRNRFTEVWIPPASSTEEYEPVVFSRIRRKLHPACPCDLSREVRLAGKLIVEFVSWNLQLCRKSLSCPASFGQSYQISLRDAAAWAEFIAEVSTSISLQPAVAFAHGARLIILDGLTVGSTNVAGSMVGDAMWRRVLELVPDVWRSAAQLASFETVSGSGLEEGIVAGDGLSFGPFTVPSTSGSMVDSGDSSPVVGIGTGFAFGARSTARSCARILRALALEKRPVLLEGPPGAGKSSVVEAVARISSIAFTRINLSEHTEMSDLMGGFVPTDKAGKFSFRRGPLLNAMQMGQWILLDELNLASQSVLEGLNAVLDHRCSVFVPEMGREFFAEPGFRVFAAQNAAHQGGGRRGLPLSFLNRFTRVSVESPTTQDIEYIARITHPTLDAKLVSCIVEMLDVVSHRLVAGRLPGASDFGTMNLRDALRWCDLLDGLGDGNIFGPQKTASEGPGVFLDTVVLQRLPSVGARRIAIDTFKEVFGHRPPIEEFPVVGISPQGQYARVGRVHLKRWNSLEAMSFRPVVSPFEKLEMRPLEALAHSVASRWPSVVVSGGPETKTCSGDGPDVIHKLGALCGQRVIEMRIGSGTDCSDLLGGYAQCDASREVRLAVSSALETSDVFLKTVFGSRGFGGLSRIGGGSTLIGEIENTLSWMRSMLASWNVSEEFVMRDKDLAYQLLSTVRDQVGRLANLCVVDGDAPNHTSPLLAFAQSLAFESRARKFSSGTKGAFEWRNSALVEAVERGDWVLIRDADQCPAAVLDRLNPLLERPPIRISTDSDRAELRKGTNGLLLTEAPSNEDGSPRIVFPHENFRIFMTVDDRRGARTGKGLSKALRNRSLEISMSTDGHLPLRQWAGHCMWAGLPGGHETLVISEWEALTSMLKVSPAVSERVVFRIAESARAFFAYMPGFSAREAVAFSFRELFGWVLRADQSKETHENQFTTSHLNESLWKAMHCASLSSMHEICIGGASVAAARDISVLRSVFEHLMMSSARSVLFDATGASFVGSETISDPEEAALSRAFYFVGEAFVMGSLSKADARARLSMLDTEAGIMGRKGSKDLKLACAAVSHAHVLEQKAWPAFGGLFCVPMDPLFAMDEGGMSLVHRLTDQPRAQEMRLAAVWFRFNMTVAAPFCVAWQEAVAGAVNTDKTRSLLFRSRIAFETGASDPDFTATDASLMELHTFPLLHAISESWKLVLDSCAVSKDWVFHCEAEWRRFLQVASRICACLGTNSRHQEDSVARFIALLKMLIASIPASVHKEATFEPLKRVLAKVSHSFANQLALIDHVSFAKRGLPSARQESTFAIEASILQLIESVAFCELGIPERKALVQALVTLSSRVSNPYECVVEAMSEVPRAIRDSVLKGKSEGRYKGVIRRELSLWEVVSEVHALSSIAQGLVHWCQFSQLPIEAKLAIDDDKRLNFSKALQNGYMSCLVGIRNIVPLQRMDWFAEADLRSTPSFYCAQLVDIERQSTRLEGMLSYFCALSHFETGLRETEVGSDGPADRYLLIDGSMFTVSAVREHQTSVRRSHLWSSAKELSETSCAAVVLMVGACGERTLGTPECAHGRELLLQSVVQMLELSLPANCISKLQTTDHRQICATGDLHAVAEILRETAGFLDNEAQNSMNRVIDVLFGALGLAHSLLKGPGDAVRLEEVVGAYGRVWSYLGLARLSSLFKMFGPRSDLDPAAVAVAEVAENSLTLLETRLQRLVYDSVASTRPGGRSSSVLGPLQSSQGCISSCEEQIGKSRVGLAFRPPNRPSVAVLRNLIKRLHESCSGEFQILAAVDEFCSIAAGCTPREGLELALMKESTLGEILSVAAERLEMGGEIGHLRDLGGSAAVAVREMRHGLALCSWAARRRVFFYENRTSVIRELFHDLFLFPRAAFRNARNPEDIFVACLKGGLEPRALQTVLELILSHVDSHGFAASSVVFSGMEKLVSVWKKEIVSTEEEAAVAGSLYRMTLEIQNSTSSASSASPTVEDQEEETDYHRTFNPSAELLAGFEEANNESSAGNPAPVSANTDMEISSEEEPQPPQGKSLPPSNAWSLYHRAVMSGLPQFASKASFVAQTRSCVTRDLVRLFGSLFDGLGRSEMAHLVESNSDRDSSVAFLATAIKLQDAQGLAPGNYPGVEVQDDQKLYNFYADPNPAEALRGASALAELSEAAYEVQKLYFKDSGDHPVLEGVSIAVERAARVSNSAPLSVLVVGIEAVLRKVDEWQRHFARKEMRMDGAVRSVAETASRWRKLEISSWPHLLDSRKNLAESKAHKWFYYLHDVIFCGHPFNEPKTKEVLVAMDSFLRSSPCGEFSLRIEMIACFGSHMLQAAARSCGSTPSFAYFLLGLSAFYGQFVENVNAAIAVARRPLDAQMKEYASLAKWDKEGSLGTAVKMARDVDRHLEYFRLKAAAESTRRKLHKVCRQMDTALFTPVSDIIASATHDVGYGDLHDSLDTAQCGNAGPSPRTSNVATFVMAVCKANTPLNHDSLGIPQDFSLGRLGRLPNLCSRMERVVRSAIASSASTIASQISSRMRQIISDRVRSLRSSPAVGVQMKQKAFSDLCRALKTLGLSPHPHHVPEARREPSHWLSTPSLGLGIGVEGGRVECDFYSAAKCLGRLRDVSAGANLSPDISRQEGVQCVSFCTHLLDMASSQRTSLHDALFLIGEISALASEISSARLNLRRTKACSSVDGKVELSIECVTYLRESRRRLSSICADVVVASKYAMNVAESGRSIANKLGSPGVPLSPDAMGKRTHLKNVLQDASQIAALLSNAVVCINERLDGLNQVAPAVQVQTLHSTSEMRHLLTDENIVETKATLEMFESLHASLQELEAAAQRLPETNLAMKTIGPVVSFTKDVLQKGQYKMQVETAGQSVLRNCSVGTIVEQAEAVVDAVLVGSQGVAKSEVLDHTTQISEAADAKRGKGQDLVIQDGFTKAHRSVMDAQRLLNLVDVKSKLTRLVESLGKADSRLCYGDYDTCPFETVANATGTFTLHFMKTVVSPILLGQIDFHQDCLRLLLTLESLFVGLCSDGYCRPPEDSSVACDEQLKTQDGAGFGDVGTGDASLAQDVSEQIEDEEQLLGLQDDSEANEAAKPRKSEEEEDITSEGLEMGNDFDGVLEDMPKPGDSENGDADGEESEPDKRISDENELGTDIVDEKLWDEDGDSPEPETATAQMDRGKEIESGGVGPEADLVAQEGDEDRHNTQKEQESVPRSKDPVVPEADKETAEEEALTGQEAKDDEVDVSEDGDTGNKRGDESQPEPKLKTEGLEKPERERVGAEELDAVGADGSLPDSENGSDGDNEGRVGDSNAREEGTDVCEPDADEAEEISGNAVRGDGEGETDGVSDEEAVQNGRADVTDGAGCGEDLPECMDLDGSADGSDSVGDEGEPREDLAVDAGQDQDEVHPHEDPQMDCAEFASKEPGEEAGETSGGDLQNTDSGDIAQKVEAVEPGLVPGERRKNSRTQGSDTVTGVFGGESNLGTCDRPPGAEQPFDGTVGSDAMENLDANGRSSTDFKGSNRHMPLAGKSGIDNRESIPTDNIDPNPLREQASEADLADQWRSRLSMLKSDVLEGTDGHPDSIEKPSPGDGLFEFVNRMPAEDEELGRDESKPVALGPATEEQHRPLPDKQERDPVTGGDDQDEQAVKPDLLSNEVASAISRRTVQDAANGESDSPGEMPIAGTSPIDKDEKGDKSYSAQCSEEDPLDRLKAHLQNPRQAGSKLPEVPMFPNERDDDGGFSDLLSNNMTEENATHQRAIIAMKSKDLTDMGELAAREVWHQLENLTSAHASALCEQLRLVLEPTLMTGMGGDFRTGKRMNMKRVIEFVASDFRRDRIWLRRVRPEKRSYDVLIAIDDSESMADSGAGPLALEALSLLTTALTRLEVGRVAVASFGSKTEVVRDFSESLPIDNNSGGRLISSFTFAQKQTDATNLLDMVYLKMCGPEYDGDGDADQTKLAFVISDGQLNESGEVRRRIRELRSAHVLVAFLIVDVLSSDRKSIFDVKRVEYDEERSGKMTVTPYMQKFPVQFYSVIRDVSVLPATLGDALRQWFEAVNAIA